VSARPGERDRPLSVEALVRAMGLILEQHIGMVWVEAELSGLKVHGSGHVYFTLKDAAAQAPAVMWRSTAQRLRFRPEEGKRYLVRVKPAIYHEQGKLQLYVEALEPLGVGAQAAAYEQLKRRLFEEGLFDPARKRPLPRLPRRIGVVTSTSGAAVRDIVRAIERRFPTPILIAAARVQGDGAEVEIVAALERLVWQPGIDVVIVGRGGGSSEDLSAFNDERVARAIARSPVPVVSAVGHEVDVTLADLVADVRAATPTAAGELCVPERAVLAEALAEIELRLGRAARVGLERRRRELERLEARAERQDPRRRLARDRQRLDELSTRAEKAVRARLAAARRGIERFDQARLGRAIAAGLGARQRTLAQLAARLDAMSPLKVLERGYAVARTSAGRVVTDAATVAPGEILGLRLARGELAVQVKGRLGPGDDGPSGGGDRGAGDPSGGPSGASGGEGPA
jgi:exodeoxyribonuclease VII large subunit